MFEIILIAILLYYLYKRFTKKSAPKMKGKRPQGYYASTPPGPRPSDRVIEEMKRCPACGTFNPKSYALMFEGEYFCSMECRNIRN